MSHTLRAAALTFSIGLALTACGSDDSPSSPSTTHGAAPSTTTAPSPTSSTNADGTLKGGARVELGHAALIKYDTGDMNGILRVTVTRIEKGSQADLKGLSGLSKDDLKATPYYVHAIIKNAGTTDLSNASIDGPHGLLKDGSEASQLHVLGGGFDKCDDFMDTGKFRPGASIKYCGPALADPGTTVTGAAWTGNGYADYPPSSGVTWTP